MAALTGCGKPAPPPRADAPPPSPVATVASTQAVTAPLVPAPPVIPEQVPERAPDTDKILLRVMWPKGVRSVYRFDLEQHSTNRLAQAPRATQEDLAIGITYAVSRSEDGGTNAQLQLQFLAFDIDVKVDGKAVMEYDSAAEGRPVSSICEPFSRLPGASVGLVLAADNTVSSFTGFDEWRRRVLGEKVEPAEQMMDQQFNEGFFRQLVEFARGLPAEPVAAGETWPQKTRIPAGALGELSVASTLALRRVEEHDDRKLAVVETAGTITGAGPPSQEGSTAGAIWFEHGAVTGTAWFDLEAGALVESAVAQQMHLGGQTANAIAAGSGGTSRFTSEIGQRVTLKLVQSEGKPR